MPAKARFEPRFLSAEGERDFKPPYSQDPKTGGVFAGRDGEPNKPGWGEQPLLHARDPAYMGSPMKLFPELVNAAWAPWAEQTYPPPQGGSKVKN